MPGPRPATGCCWGGGEESAFSSPAACTASAAPLGPVDTALTGRRLRLVIRREPDGVEAPRAA
ncbi:hypothetical protein HCC61_09435 [Streptomyces sp. HNM0575]|uniref:hypothetical protein n=1 Tax=Streptomyces sp. HNM0575 TaxID=2716338 RepID=UPI00145CF7A3|nr:hypothetical protein [Streptomyces sp. HNM0575]NLU72896.1 hypothetical protein [Streptomyces sp. HNM0575]